MPIYYLTKDSWKRLLTGFTETFDIYILREKENGLFYEMLSKEDLSGDGEIIYGKARSIQSLKSFFHLYAEDVSSLGNETGKRLIIGAKACDLKALAVLDKMFLEGDYIDPFYKEKRDNTIIISSDCTEPRNSCFCTLLGGKPYAEDGFDLNLSPLNEGFIIEAGSDKGKALITGNKSIFGNEAKETLNEDRARAREKTTGKVNNKNKDYDLKAEFWKGLSKKHDSSAWEEHSEACVECGACTVVCPSCYCFLLADMPAKDKFKRVKYQDSCQFSGYARVAGGATPRPGLYERFRNRYLCKYDYRPETLGMVACTGCGRCIEACQGKIDKREVVVDVLKRKK